MPADAAIESAVIAFAKSPAAGKQSWNFATPFIWSSWL